MKTINKIRINNFEGMIEMTEKGETLIKKIQRILDENEPLTDGAPMIYTPKQAGVREDCNVRTDKWALAMDAMARVVFTQKFSDSFSTMCCGVTKEFDERV